MSKSPALSYSAESAASAAPLNSGSQGSGSLTTATSMNPQSASSSTTTLKSPSTATSQNFTDNLDNGDLSLAAFPALEPRRPDTKMASSIKLPLSGGNSFGSLNQLSLISLSLNNLKEFGTPIEDCLRLSTPLMKSGMWANGKLLQQDSWEHHISDRDYSWLPTPTTYATSLKKGQSNAGRNKLEIALRAKGINPQGLRLSEYLTIEDNESANPAVWEWMMGFPAGYATSVLMKAGMVPLLYGQESQASELQAGETSLAAAVGPSLPNKPQSPSGGSATSIPCSEIRVGDRVLRTKTLTPGTRKIQEKGAVLQVDQAADKPYLVRWRHSLNRAKTWHSLEEFDAVYREIEDDFQVGDYLEWATDFWGIIEAIDPKRKNAYLLRRHNQPGDTEWKPRSRIDGHGSEVGLIGQVHYRRIEITHDKHHLAELIVSLERKTTIAANELFDLTEQIFQSHHDCIEAATTASNARRAELQHALDCGRALIAAKAKLPHGSWLDWLKAEAGKRGTKLAPRTAQEYTRLAEKWPQIEAEANARALAHLTKTEALKLIAQPKGQKAAALRQEIKDRAQSRQLQTEAVEREHERNLSQSLPLEELQRMDARQLQAELVRINQEECDKAELLTGDSLYQTPAILMARKRAVLDLLVEEQSKCAIARAFEEGTDYVLPLGGLEVEHDIPKERRTLSELFDRLVEVGAIAPSDYKDNDSLYLAPFSSDYKAPFRYWKADSALYKKQGFSDEALDGKQVECEAHIVATIQEDCDRRGWGHWLGRVEGKAEAEINGYCAQAESTRIAFIGAYLAARDSEKSINERK